MIDIAFYFFSAMTLTMAYIAVSSRNVLYSLSALAAGLIFVSGLYFLLNAEFLGVVQISVYAGAVVVLYGLSMGFFSLSEDILEKNKHPKLLFILSGFIALVLVLMFSIPTYAEKVNEAPKQSDLKALGHILYTDYFLAVEMVCVLLLVGMVAGVVVGMQKKEDEGSLS